MIHCPVCEGMNVKLIFDRAGLADGLCKDCASTWKQDERGTDHWSVTVSGGTKRGGHSSS